MTSKGEMDLILTLTYDEIILPCHLGCVSVDILVIYPHSMQSYINWMCLAHVRLSHHQYWYYRPPLLKQCGVNTLPSNNH